MRTIPLDLLPDFEAALSAQIAGGSLAQRRDALAIALGLHGLRVGEVTQLVAGDLYIPGRTLSVRTLKGGLPREIPLDASLVDAIVAWREAAGLSRAAPLLATRTGKPPVRTQFSRAANKMTLQVIGERLRFHDLRHTFGTRLYAQTRDVLLVKKMLGHRDIDSTMVYVHAFNTLPPSCQVKLLSCEPLSGFPVRREGVQLTLFDPDDMLSQRRERA